MIALTPALWDECQHHFNVRDLDHRFLQGGLPESLLASTKSPSFFGEWLDSFYARDIQELFGIRNRTGFLNLLRLLMRQSGGLVDYTQLAKLSDLSRPTVKLHLEAMCIAHAAYLLRPFHGGGRREITRRPKCYAFDTGFVTYVNGWNEIREGDRGILWEHLVLDMLRTLEGENTVYYWQDKSGREIDFVIKRDRNSVDTIECKINPAKYSSTALDEFRKLYPDGRNYCICPYVKEAYSSRHNQHLIEYWPLNHEVIFRRN